MSTTKLIILGIGIAAMVLAAALYDLLFRLPKLKADLDEANHPKADHPETLADHHRRP